MTTHTRTTDDPAAELPTTLHHYLATHAARDVEAALAAFTPDAVVVDQDATFRGREEIRGFLARAGAEFTYTTEQVGTRRDGRDRWVVAVRLEGDFPGGVADLDYRFSLDGELIDELVIADAGS